MKKKDDRHMLLKAVLSAVQDDLYVILMVVLAVVAAMLNIKMLVSAL